MKKLKIGASALLVLLQLAACSSVPSRDLQERPNADQLVSRDLVNVLYQVSSLDPAKTTLLMPQPPMRDDQFARSLLNALEQAGYSIRTRGSNRPALAVSYAISRRVDVDQAPVLTYTVKVGEISVRRAYQPQSDGWISPIAAMQIKGADASKLSLNDDIFNRSGDHSLKTIDAPNQGEVPGIETDLQPAVPPPGDAPKPILTETDIMAEVQVTPVEIEQPEPLQGASISENASIAEGTSIIESQLASNRAQSTIPLRNRSDLAQGRPLLDIVAPGLARADAAGARAGGDRSADRETANFKDIGGSNFAALFNGLGTVNETILTFKNDSTRLGLTNKERIKQVVALFDPDSDVFSVIGCSHGSTVVPGGQQALALGRASRVKEELQFAGIPENKILDEGCWAEESFDQRMPRRGVVLTLKRRG
jgi:hypothetical protein